MEANEAVAAANEAFYRAFETLNIKEMEKVWLEADQICSKLDGICRIVT